MKNSKFLLLGIFFGIVLFKAEIVSWYRIYEMFRFESFHMYGVIGSAVLLGALTIQYIKRKQFKSIEGNKIKFTPKNKSITRYLFGGTLFGLGWALIGGCPGPMFILLGTGSAANGIVLLAALLGTFFYGVVRKHLPH